MFVSGNLKDKSVNFYKEQIDSFDSTGIEASNITFNYTGEMIFSPWDQDKELKLIKKQEQYIEKLKHRILTIMAEAYHKDNTLFFLTSVIIEKIINKIRFSKRNITYKLLECLYRIITNPSNYHLVDKLKDFEKLIDDLNEFGLLYQWDIDIIIDLFIKNRTYTYDDIRRENMVVFNISEDDFANRFRDIILMGKFIAPRRVKTVARSIKDEVELTKYIVPIYFAIKSDTSAQQFLSMCKKTDLDIDEIEKNASLCRVPSNIINMVRR